MNSVDPRSGFCAANSVFYSKRKPVPLPADEYLDVTTFISSRRHYGTTALIDAATGRRISFSELWRSVSSAAAVLSSCFGVRKGHVILLLSPNSIHFPVVSLAVMFLGAVITTTNPLNTSQEIAKQIADSNPVVAFTTSELLAKLHGRNFPIVLLEEKATGVDDSRIFCTITDMINSSSTGVKKEKVRQNDAATLLYSSGTTGASKGVVSTHRNLITMVEIVTSTFQIRGEQDRETFICTVPMFHIYGLAFFATGLLASGSTIVVLTKFEMGDMLKAITNYDVTYLPLVPPILVAMIRNSKPLPLGPLKKVLSGGAPLSKEVIEGFRGKYPDIEILQGYGLTESTGIGASMDSTEESRRYGTAGLLRPNTEARIVDPETGKYLPVNHTGELWIRGPYIMKGYFKNKEATKETLDEGGWLRTGDLCYFDEDGYLFVVDRLKELIKYKCYQVPPAELEALLLTHPDITDAAVIPFPDKEVGQYPMAYVVRKAGCNLSHSEVMEFVEKQACIYPPSAFIFRSESLHIRRSGEWHFCPPFPRMPLGKYSERISSNLQPPTCNNIFFYAFCILRRLLLDSVKEGDT